VAVFFCLFCTFDPTDPATPIKQLLNLTGITESAIGGLLEFYLGYKIQKENVFTFARVSCAGRLTTLKMDNIEKDPNNVINFLNVKTYKLEQSYPNLTVDFDDGTNKFFLPTFSNYPDIDFIIVDSAKQIHVFQVTVEKISSHAARCQFFSDPKNYGATGVRAKFKKNNENVAEAWYKLVHGKQAINYKGSKGHLKNDIRNPFDGYYAGIRFYWIGYPEDYPANTDGTYFINIKTLRHFKLLAEFI